MIRVILENKIYKEKNFFPKLLIHQFRVCFQDVLGLKKNEIEITIKSTPEFVGVRMPIIINICGFVAEDKKIQIRKALEKKIECIFPLIRLRHLIINFQSG